MKIPFRPFSVILIIIITIFLSAVASVRGYSGSHLSFPIEESRGIKVPITGKPAIFSQFVPLPTCSLRLLWT